MGSEDGQFWTSQGSKWSPAGSGSRRLLPRKDGSGGRQTACNQPEWLGATRMLAARPMAAEATYVLRPTDA